MFYALNGLNNCIIDRRNIEKLFLSLIVVYLTSILILHKIKSKVVTSFTLMINKIV